MSSIVSSTDAPSVRIMMAEGGAISRLQVKAVPRVSRHKFRVVKSRPLFGLGSSSRIRPLLGIKGVSVRARLHRARAGLRRAAKAKLVAEGSFPGTVGDGLAPEVKSHKLVDLLHRTGLTLSNEESYLARRLQAFVEWSGRYPIPAQA
jgi:hypothetical protein